jgi:hypothetical protein
MTLARIFKTAFAGLALWFLCVLADHLYMLHGATYPAWLSESVTIKSTGDRGIEGFTELCGGVGGWDFYHKENGNFMRCKTILTGSYARPTTYRIENYAQLADEE